MEANHRQISSTIADAITYWQLEMKRREAGDDPRAKSQRLHEEVGDVGADAAQQVAGRGAGRGVEAGVVDAPAGQRQRQRTAHHRGQAAAEPRAGRVAPRAAQLIQRNL